MMTIEQFASFINYDNKEKQMPKYFDEHLAIYTLLHGMVQGKESGIAIDFKEDKNCKYVLSAIDGDISYMQNLFANLQMKVAAHHYNVDVQCIRGIVYIRFLDTLVGV